MKYGNKYRVNRTEHKCRPPVHTHIYTHTNKQTEKPGSTGTEEEQLVRSHDDETGFGNIIIYRLRNENETRTMSFQKNKYNDPMDDRKKKYIYTYTSGKKKIVERTHKSSTGPRNFSVRIVKNVYINLV